MPLARYRLLRAPARQIHGKMVQVGEVFTSTDPWHLKSDYERVADDEPDTPSPVPTPEPPPDPHAPPPSWESLVADRPDVDTVRRRLRRLTGTEPRGWDLPSLELHWRRHHTPALLSWMARRLGLEPGVDLVRILDTTGLRAPDALPDEEDLDYPGPPSDGLLPVGEALVKAGAALSAFAETEAPGTGKPMGLRDHLIAFRDKYGRSPDEAQAQAQPAEAETEAPSRLHLGALDQAPVHATDAALSIPGLGTYEELREGRTLIEARRFFSHATGQTPGPFSWDGLRSAFERYIAETSTTEEG